MSSLKIINTIQLFPNNFKFSSETELKYLLQFLVRYLYLFFFKLIFLIKIFVNDFLLLIYGEPIWIWSYLVHVLPASSRSVCFLSSVPTLPFLRYGTTILVPSCVRHTYLCRLQYKFLRIPSTGFFSSNTDTCIPVLPYKVKTLL